MQAEGAGQLLWAGKQRWQAIHPYLLEGALVLHALGPHEHPAIPEGQVLDVLAA